MSAIEKYNAAFMNTFGIDEGQLQGLKYQDIKTWDSIGHMQLMTNLEESFDIELDIDDITDFSGYEKGMLILEKYSVSLNT